MSRYNPTPARLERDARLLSTLLAAALTRMPEHFATNRTEETSAGTCYESRR